MAAAAGDVIQEEDEDPDHPESNVSGGWPSSSSLHSSHGDVPQNPQNQEEPEAMAEAASVAGSSGSPSHHPHPHQELQPYDAAGLQEDHQIEDDHELLLEPMMAIKG